ncbi:MAG: malonyl-CoA decarboxylase [Kiloniellales bacterium]
MAETQGDSFFERALANLASAWRDVAAGAARTVRLNGVAPRRSPEAWRALMAECLEARGGEVSARLRAAELGKTYLELEGDDKRRFLEVLARDFATDQEQVIERITAYVEATDAAARMAAEESLRRTLVPPRVKLLTQFNALPEGVKFLTDLRADLLKIEGDDPYLRGLERDLRELLVSWFDVGFLDLRRITWDSAASLLERLIAYEAVHEIRSWQDLRNRLDSARRLYALFHPRMPEEPLAFVEVALVKGMADSIQALLDESAPAVDPKAIDTAIFYSISNTQKGLRGISFGDYLIKRVVHELSHDLPRLKSFATLSPVPGFRAWLDRATAATIAALLSEDEQGGVRALGGSDQLQEALEAILERPDWWQDPVTATALRAPLLRLCTLYFLERRPAGDPIDPVARFHLRNGARLERINWLGDTSANGLRQSAGLMVNYSYVVDDIEKNHEAYMQRGAIAMGPEVRTLAKSVRRGAA